MDDVTGMLIRLLMYLVSFVLVLTFLALMPDSEAADHLRRKKYHGYLLLPLSDHDRVKWSAYFSASRRH